MSIFDAFKPQWSAHKMTPEDRKKIFWYLLRKTSYTAWKREADAFDKFATLFQKQVREEPVSKAEVSMGDTRWEWFYPEVVKSQVLYEKALQNLLCGDRTVWLHNSRGIFVDAKIVSGDWYSELVNNGMRGDHFYDGKYVAELTEAIKQFSLTSRDTAQILQPMVAETPAPEFWSIFWQETFSELPLPLLLPDIPIPQIETLVRTQEPAPVFGIYEPQIRDGCMNYLLGGVPAPTVWESDGSYTTGKKLSVVWRLIWEDTRYLDEIIPPEEDHYFPNDYPLVTASSMTVSDELVSAITNDKCPRSGHWAVMDDIEAKSVLEQGEKMPQYCGRDVTWVWLKK